ncbi:MAG: hypothetical protein ACE5GM_04670 [bacterium]
MKKLIIGVILLFIMGCLVKKRRIAPPPPLQRAVPSRVSLEMRLYSNICGECHAVPEPRYFTYSKWKSMVKIMENRREAQGFSPLGQREKEALLSYLKKYAREDVRLLNSPEAKLFNSRCGLCHPPPDPRKYKYSQWLELLPRMEEKMKKGLKRSERNYILSYIRKHVKEIIKVDGLDTPEARTYAQKCSVCHPLKDPAIYSYQKWKDEIIPEMEEAMSDEDKSLTDTEKKEILAFLKKRAKRK